MSYLDDLYGLGGKTAIVTGAAKGNGRSLAAALARAGAKVWLVDALEPVLEAAVAELKREGLEVAGLARDLTDPGTAEAIVEAVRAESGRIDVLVNNAGITRGGEALTYPEDAWDQTLAVNLTAHFRLCQAVARVMKEGGGGSIVNITSLNAEQAFPGNPAYVASKGALKMLGKSLALDLAAHGIRVNNLGPGYFRTDMTAKSWANEETRAARGSRTMLGRWGDPEKDLAGAIVFLASDASAYVTGQDLYVDGGWLAKGL